MVKHTLRNDRGSALVELALTVPLLFLILIGAVELGRIAYFAIEVSDAARAGVAYGAQGPNTAPLTSNIEAAATAAAPDVPSLHAVATTPCVCETINTSTGAVTTTPLLASCAGQGSTVDALCSSSADTRAIVVNYVQVTTSANVSTLFHYPWIPASFTLSGFAKMRVLQD